MMKVNTKYLLLGFGILICTSCSHLYAPALFRHDIAYQPKPASFDSVKSATYISGAYNFYTSANAYDEISSGQLNVSRGYVFKNMNLAFGGFGAFGGYQNGTVNQNPPSDFTEKYFEAVGGRVSANLFVHDGNTDFRYIGVEAAYSHEFGPYSEYRKFASTQPGFVVDSRTDLFTAGLSSERIFHNNSNTLEQAIRVFVGSTFGYNPLNAPQQYSYETAQDKLLRGIFLEASYFITYHRYFFTVEVGNQLFLRLGYKF